MSKVISGVNYLSNRSTQPRSSTAVLLSSSHLAKGKGASTRRLVSGTHGGLLGMSDGIGFPAKMHFNKAAKLIVEKISLTTLGVSSLVYHINTE